MRIVPFYYRTALINDTPDTLNTVLSLEVITMLVVPVLYCEVKEHQLKKNITYRFFP